MAGTIPLKIIPTSSVLVRGVWESPGPCKTQTYLVKASGRSDESSLGIWYILERHVNTHV